MTIDIDNKYFMKNIDDRSPFVFIEKAKVSIKNSSILVSSSSGCSQLMLNDILTLFLGHGVSITHSAVLALAKFNVNTVWYGDKGFKVYSVHTSNNYNKNIAKQAKLSSDINLKTMVARNMFELRFNEDSKGKTIEQLRGMEGVRIRNCYREQSEKYGIKWSGRNFEPGHPEKSDAVNRLLSFSNSVLYGICNAVIQSYGYSPSLGFIHTGFNLSFVYDIADLYKTEIVIPKVFELSGLISSEPSEKLFKEYLLELSQKTNFLKRIINDINFVLYNNIESEIFKNL